MSSFIIGMSLIYLGWSRGQIRGHLGENIGCAADDVDVASELEVGVNTIIEWFPKEAVAIRQNKDDIIKHIALITEPAAESPLLTLKLTHSLMPGEAHELMLPLLAEENLVNNLHIRRLRNGNSSLHKKNMTDDCSEAVADFLCDTLEFVTGLMRFTIPRRYALRVFLLSWLQQTYNRHELKQLSQQIFDFAQAPDSKKKTRAMWRLLRKTWKAGGGFVRVLLNHLADQAKSPWETLQKCVRLAAQMAMWIGKGVDAFVGTVTFQLLSAKKMVESAKIAGSACNLSQFIDHHEKLE
jgi:hypothetical protein